jgi:DNA-damage-inducible protein D
MEWKMSNENDGIQIAGALSPFERIRRTNDSGAEYWTSRDFAVILGYRDYRNFETVIDKARLSCLNSGHRIEDHFVDTTEMVNLGSGAQRSIKSVLLSRYACYLIVQNADPSKEIVALGQTYFTVQTRRQELSDQAPEKDRRLLLREEIKMHNIRLAGTAKMAGVIEPRDYAIFQDHGYRGLYGGLGAKDIHRRKKLQKGQQILDHMGTTELAANLFRATQTEEKLRRDKIAGKERAYHTHLEVGAKVRKTIQELGGTMPENLPAAESIKKLEVKMEKKSKRISGKRNQTG